MSVQCCDYHYSKLSKYSYTVSKGENNCFLIKTTIKKGTDDFCGFMLN